MTAGWANPVRVGLVNGSTPLVVDLSLGVMGGNVVLKTVTLSQSLVLENPPGYPTRPYSGGAANIPTPGKTYNSGTVLNLLAPEADALVTLGAAAYS